MASLIRKPFRYVYWHATFAIILLNIIVFLIEKTVPSSIYYLSLNLINCLVNKFWWQPFTYMFVHGNFQHIFFNMLGLFFFGVSVEKALGTKEFLLMYLLVGLLGGLFSLGIYYITGTYRVFLMGASGALYGMLLAFAVIYPREKIWIWGLIPVPAPILVLAYAVIEFGSQVLGVNSGVAHSVHLAGFAFAWLYFVIRMGINPIRVWKDAYR